VVSLTLPNAYAAQMIAEARAANPAEACGLIAGLDGSPTKLYPIPNGDPSIYRYNMDPKSQLAAMNDIEARGWAEELGITLRRAASLNAGDDLVAALAVVARSLVDEAAEGE